MFTFHKLIEGCEAGRAEAWRAFASEYTGLSLAMLRIHLREANASQASDAWQATVRFLAVPESQSLRALDRQSEKEFLLGLRRLALTHAASLASGNSTADAATAPDTIQASWQGRPLTHQQIVLLKFAGYDDPTIERLLRVAPTIVQRAAEGQPGLRTPDAVDWFHFLDLAWSGATPDCVAPRTLVRLQEGQTTWYDREPVERHVAACLHCLELWTALAEVRYWRREARALPEAEAAKLLEGLRPVLATAR